MRRCLQTLALGGLACLVAGCTLLELAKVRETERARSEYARLSGTISPGPVDAEWMVIYAMAVPCNDDWSELRRRVAEGRFTRPPASWRAEDRALVDRIEKGVSVADHIVRQRPGVWWMTLAPGCYGVGAFADLNRDYKYDDEPVATALSSPDRLVELSAGDDVRDVALVIDPAMRIEGNFDPVAEQMRRGGLRSHSQQMLVSIGEVSVEGKVVALSDARFGEENGKLGYFEIFRFLWEAGPGVYFLEEYDPDRIPVLFVHGALGYPQQFGPLIDALDRTRFQPWFFFYPSGAQLDPIAEYLTDVITALRLRLHFDELAVVAHSMGGLVAREFILRNHQRAIGDPVRVFVSISTPWGGVPSAAEGVDRSPFVVPSWRDVRPDSPFLSGLFYDASDPEERRRLPGAIHHRLIFGVVDETIPVPSAIRWEALRDADDRWPLPNGHVDILGSPDAARLLNEALAGFD